jgi:hypothetical protein
VNSQLHVLSAFSSRESPWCSQEVRPGGFGRRDEANRNTNMKVSCLCLCCICVCVKFIVLQYSEAGLQHDNMPAYTNCYIRFGQPFSHICTNEECHDFLSACPPYLSTL